MGALGSGMLVAMTLGNSHFDALLDEELASIAMPESTEPNVTLVGGVLVAVRVHLEAPFRIRANQP